MHVVLAGPGTVLAGRYALERELGRGGSATVHLANDLKHHRPVAVKILRPEVAITLGSERFLREIEIAARLTHPHILPLYDSGDSDGVIYYVMPYVDGESLRHRIRQGALPVDKAVRIACEVADALAYAHQRGVVHRDIKPDNILLESEHAVVTDFGIARAMVEAGGQEVTSSGLIMGTPTYMSPEQASGGVVDGRTDVYGLGCVLYEMLVGKPPFEAATPQAVAALHLGATPRPVRATRPSVPPDIENAIATALEKLPEDRFPDASQFAAVLSGLITTRSRSPRKRGVKRPLGAALSVMMLGGAAFWGYSADPGTLDPNRVLVLPMEGDSSAHSPPFEATLALIASLNSTPSLNSIDAAKVAPGISGSAAGRLAQRQHAGYYVESKLLASDSLRLLLDLNDMRDGSVTHRVLSFANGSNGWTIGVRAALELVPLLIRTGRPPELPSLVGRSPAALGEYFLGEQHYRRAAFDQALEHFKRAVAVDSGFALAALRGAQAADWHLRPAEAEALISVALAHEQVLPVRQRVFARGFDAWRTGRADAAVQRFREAIALDPSAVEPWMALAETYNHLIPLASPLDSLAENAYLRVNELDSTYAPVLLHLLEFAVRHNDRDRAARLVAKYRQAASDPGRLGFAELMLRCVQDSISDAGWREAVLRNPANVMAAAQSLALGGLRQPVCAHAAWKAIWFSDTTTGSTRGANRFGALLGLHSLLVARGRYDELRTLMQGDTLLHPKYRGQLYILGALAGGDFEKEADNFADAGLRLFRSGRGNLGNNDLWFLGSWLAHRGRTADAAEMAGVIRATGDEPRHDSLLAASLEARTALASGDSAEALRQLRALTPNATSDLTWAPWEALAGERLLLAQLLMASNQTREAVQVAANFDSPVPISYLMYLPASLSLRIQGAERLGDDRLAQLSRKRLVALGSASQD